MTLYHISFGNPSNKALSLSLFRQKCHAPDVVATVHSQKCSAAKAKGQTLAKGFATEAADQSSWHRSVDHRQTLAQHTRNFADFGVHRLSTAAYFDSYLVWPHLDSIMLDREWRVLDFNFTNV